MILCQLKVMCLSGLCQCEWSGAQKSARDRALLILIIFHRAECASSL